MTVLRCLGVLQGLEKNAASKAYGIEQICNWLSSKLNDDTNLANVANIEKLAVTDKTNNLDNFETENVVTVSQAIIPYTNCNILFYLGC